jgi:hypothetical protein
MGIKPNLVIIEQITYYVSKFVSQWYNFDNTIQYMYLVLDRIDMAHIVTLIERKMNWLVFIYYCNHAFLPNMIIAILFNHRCLCDIDSNNFLYKKKRATIQVWFSNFNDKETNSTEIIFVYCYEILEIKRFDFNATHVPHVFLFCWGPTKNIFHL